jgi:DNA-directed RNA polymerase specialized sigma subunit
MTAKLFLSRANRLDLRINTKLEQLVRLRSLACQVTRSIRHDNVKGSGTPKSALEDAVVKIVMAEQDINDEIDRFVDIKREITDMLGLLDNDDQRLLLELRYLCFDSWEQIADKLCISVSYAYQLHRAALYSFEDILNRHRGYIHG